MFGIKSILRQFWKKFGIWRNKIIDIQNKAKFELRLDNYEVGHKHYTTTNRTLFKIKYYLIYIVIGHFKINIKIQKSIT